MTLDLGDWEKLPFFRDGQYQRVISWVRDDPREILPPEDAILAALRLTAPADTKVVILGQDPYPTPGHAHGLAFSVEPHVQPLPRSLSNIYEELKADIGACPDNGDLRFWAAQGVLLLNSVLTVPAGEADGHAAIGWAPLTGEVLAALSDRPRAFVLWGKKAQAQAKAITGDGHLMIETAHPSPLSARRGFFGSKPFSRVNAWLAERGEREIDWVGASAGS